MADTSVAIPLGVLASTPATLRALLAGLTEEIISAPADDGWSPRDVVAHLASLDPLTLVGRVRAIIDQDQPAITAIDQHDVLERSGMRKRPLTGAIDEMAQRRTIALGWLRELTPQELERTGTHAIVGPLSVTEIIHHKAWHDLLHIQQISRMLSKPLDAGSGGMRQFH